MALHLDELQYQTLSEEQAGVETNRACKFRRLQPENQPIAGNLEVKFAI
jgi:hypothetical protein